ncbi:MAG: hypothetical protein O6952_03395 [Planctomycetota bacterium]|nr:hypothetical protein [Planctomycetota bacterium]
MRTHSRNCCLIAALLTLGLPSLALANGSSRVSDMDGYFLPVGEHPSAAGRDYPGLESLGATLLAPRQGLIQDELPPPWRSDSRPLEGQTGPPAMRPAGLRMRTHEIGVEIFGAGLEGSVAVEAGNSFSDDIDYDDLFEGGSGLNLNYRLQFHRDSGYGRSLIWGPYGKIQSILFEGDSVEDDLFNALTADDMRITTLTVGAHGGWNSRRFFLAMQMGIGLAIINEVDATYYDDFNAVTISGTLYDSTATFGLESEFRLGWKWRGRFAFSFFSALGYGLTLAPKEGDLFGSDTDAEFITWVSFGIGLAVDFGGVQVMGQPSAPPYREDERAAAPREVFRR